MKKIIGLSLVSVMMTIFAVDYCRDCDRGIADGKEYCNKCAEKRRQREYQQTKMFLDLLSGTSAREAER